MEAFSEKKRRIPKTVEECIAPNATAVALEQWAARVQVVGRLVFAGMALLFLISIIFNAIMANVESEIIDYFINKDNGNVTMIISVLSDILRCSVYLVLEYSVYHIVVLLLNTAATLVKNSEITTSLELYKVRNEAKEEGSNKNERSYSIPLTRTVPIEERVPVETLIQNWYGAPTSLEEKLSYVDVICPGCGESLSFEDTVCEAACPCCDTVIKLK